MLNGLSLFSGIGGLDIALSEWVKPVCYCEIEPYAAGVLFSRMADESLPRAPIFPDVRHLTAAILPPIDIIYGGFPCQDVSLAGSRAGLDGERTGLFREAVRLVSECKPKFVFLENVPGIRRFVPTVRGELEALGYRCRDGFLPAPPLSGFEGIRWFLLAAAESELGEGRVGIHSLPLRAEGPTLGANQGELPCAWEASFRDSCGDADGISARMDRLKCCGNAVVPAQAKEAFKRLAGVS